MSIMTIEEAQAQLPELIARLAPGEEVLLTRNAQPVAKLVGQPRTDARPILGRGKGKVIIVSEDDDHLQGFEEYMQ
jgi:antitoxin (DNA-binding transcriptional repressor) of toxin-antitoxin stability system